MHPYSLISGDLELQPVSSFIVIVPTSPRHLKRDRGFSREPCGRRWATWQAHRVLIAATSGLQARDAVRPRLVNQASKGETKE